MSSVIQNEPLVKAATVYDAGVKVPMDVVGNPEGKGGGKRGEINAFTKAARRRMRNALLTMDIPDSVHIGLTLTVPWSKAWVEADDERCNDEFRECWHRFAKAFRDNLPECAAIYRVELQQRLRKAPHIHALCYIPRAAYGAATSTPVAGVDGTDDAIMRDVGARMIAMWIRAVPDLHGGSLGGFGSHGAHVQAIPDHGAMMRYMCDHATKCKELQLGYKGKQWGIVNRNALQKGTGTALAFPDDHTGEIAKARFVRYLRRATAYHRKAACPFGYKVLPSRRMAGVYYGDAGTVQRLYALALQSIRAKEQS